MSEVNAAFGLLQLNYVDQFINSRQKIADIYMEQLEEIPGISCILDLNVKKHNYSYFPIIIDESKYGKSRDSLYEHLKTKDIYPRRYFYPLISNFKAYKNFPKPNLPIANRASSQILCLPIYPMLSFAELKQITNFIKDF